VKGLVARVAGANRYFIAVAAGIAIAIAVLVVLGLLWSDEAFGRGWRQAFYQGLLTSVCFFGLVGVAALVQQVHASRGDILRKRVEYLFATRHSVSPPLVDYVESLVKRNALYSSDTVNLVEILEYDEDLKAYRVSMDKRFVLHNVFGDLEQNERIPLNFAPDLVADSVNPLAELTLLETTHDGHVTRRLSQPQGIPAEGLRHEFDISLRPGEVVTVEHEHWTWASNVGNSGFGLRRFSERTRVIVRNRSRVTARVYRPESPGEVFELKYREDVTIRDAHNVPEMERLDFSWLPPTEFPEPGDHQRGEGIHPILQWNPNATS
jgi:hypothetical protein